MHWKLWARRSLKRKQRLWPGEAVGINPKTGIASTRHRPHVGIDDPFFGLKPIDRGGEWARDSYGDGAIEEGDHVWIMLFPRTITGLRHLWEHPDLPLPKEEAPVSPEEAEATETYRAIDRMFSDSDEIIERQADELGLTVEEVLEAARDYVDTDGGSYICEGGRFEGCRLVPDFWRAFKDVTGKEPISENAGFWSCSC